MIKVKIGFFVLVKRPKIQMPVEKIKKVKDTTGVNSIDRETKHFSGKKCLLVANLIHEISETTTM